MPVADWMGTWTLRKGYPVVSASLTQALGNNKGMVSISQVGFRVAVDFNDQCWFNIYCIFKGGV